MATATTVEHSEPKLAHEAEKLPRTEIRRISIDTNFVAMAGLLALAVAAFSYLNSRIDTLGSELRADMKRYAERTDDKFDQVNARFEKLNKRIDRLTDKINELLIEQKRVR